MKTCSWMRYVAALAFVWAIGNLSTGNLSNKAWAEDAAAGNAASPGANADAAKKPTRKDPTASAFALPGGTKLNAKQQAAYDQLKADKQPELQQAIDDLQNSKSGATAKAAKKVRDLRTEIRNSINDIVYAPSSSSSNRDSGGGSDGSNSNGNGYAIPYGGYYPYRANYGGYYPYLYYPRTTDGKLSGTKGGTSGDRKLPSRPPANRPAASSAASGGAKR